MGPNSVRSPRVDELQGRLGQPYKEKAFRYLLDTERRRAERLGRPILLLLVSLHDAAVSGDRIPPATAASIFAGLSACVREVDFIGWFRQERVAAVALTQGGDPLLPEAPSRLGQRIAQALKEYVGSEVAERLHVRVLQLQPTNKRRGI